MEEIFHINWSIVGSILVAFFIRGVVRAIPQLLVQLLMLE